MPRMILNIEKKNHKDIYGHTSRKEYFKVKGIKSAELCFVNSLTALLITNRDNPINIKRNIIPEIIPYVPIFFIKIPTDISTLRGK